MAILSLIATLMCATPTAEVFVDRGDFFVRAGTREGLKVGMELELQPGGKASVMEVWEKLARISPDEAGKKAKAAKLPEPGKADAAPAASACPDQPNVEPVSYSWSIHDDEIGGRCCGTNAKVLVHETALGAEFQFVVDGKPIETREVPSGNEVYFKAKNAVLKVNVGRGGGDYSLKIAGKPCQLSKQ